MKLVDPDKPESKRIDLGSVNPTMTLLEYEKLFETKWSKVAENLSEFIIESFVIFNSGFSCRFSGHFRSHYLSRITLYPLEGDSFNEDFNNFEEFSKEFSTQWSFENVDNYYIDIKPIC
jgi:hypothetical protein